MQPEFPEHVINLVQEFALKSGYEGYTREEAIREIEDHADMLLKTERILPGQAHKEIVERVNREGAEFLIFPCTTPHPVVMMNGHPLMAPGKRKGHGYRFQ